jgi:hypothetical protein
MPLFPPTVRYFCGPIMSRFVLLGFLLGWAASMTPAAEPGGILSGETSVERLSRILSPASAWHPFPRSVERKEWLKLPAAVRAAHIREGERFLNAEWAAPRATDFLEFVRTGNRSHYQGLSFGRRQQLATLVLAECMEGKGRFLDDVVNGVWTISEETFWGVPAHLSLQRKGFGLPDVTEPTVDLFAAETGSLFAWTYYLLKDSLDARFPLVSERIRHEVHRRILTVNLERDDFWWMGQTQKVNNWNPWICSNWLAAVLILEENPTLRARSVYKILECLDRFLDVYADDGGCDEGPTYWTRAGGSLLDCLELLEHATGGRINGFANARIREIGRYIMRAHIQGPYYVNFADAAAKASPEPGPVFRYGKNINDSMMMAFGAYLAQMEKLGSGAVQGRFGVLGRVLPALFSLDDLLRTRPAEPLLRDFWFPGVQVMGARSSGGSMRGLYLVAQGGHNGESHNHNDVGNFIVYADGEPVIIDVGVETYTAKTFSADRYSIWTMQSAYHNLPTINGVEQKDGREYSARDVRYTAGDTAATLSMDIAGAYPREAGVRSWRRRLTLVRGREVTVHDAYVLDTLKGGIRLTLMTNRAVTVGPPGTILLGDRSGTGKVRDVTLMFDPALFEADVEAIKVQDGQLQSSWGDRLERILLTLKQPRVVGDFTVSIR